MPLPKKRPKVPHVTQMMPVDRLAPTADNRRRTITQSSVESLAKSVKQDGVIQPIIVRPHPEKEGWWEIRAGERRWRAAKLAGLTHIPAIIRTLDDVSALSVTIAENLQRQNLHPLEEAETIQLAFDRGYDAKAVAAKLGKSVIYIARRASLTKLCKVWRDAVLTPETKMSRLSVAHLELIARLPEETQQALADNDFAAVFRRGFPTVEELRTFIDGALHTLKAMPWDLADDTLDPKAGACLNCAKRSGMHPMLFDPEDAPNEANGKVSKTDRCLDPMCFEGKCAAHLERRESELRTEHPNLRLVQIGYDGLSPQVREKFASRVTQVYAPKFVKHKAKGATPAMQLDGPKAGALVHIDFGDSVSRNGTQKSSKRATDESGKVVPLTLAERQARLQKRRDAFLVTKVRESLQAVTHESLVATVAKIRTRADTAARTFDPLALVLAFGTSTRADYVQHHDDPWKRYEGLHDRTADLPVIAALREVAQVWTRRLSGSDKHHVTEQAADAKRVCELLGLDAVGIEIEAKRVIPTPKSWEALAANSAQAGHADSTVESADDGADDGDDEGEDHAAEESPPFEPTASSSTTTPPTADSGASITKAARSAKVSRKSPMKRSSRTASTKRAPKR